MPAKNQNNDGYTIFREYHDYKVPLIQLLNKDKDKDKYDSGTEIRGTITIPDNQYFVLGDNRSDSEDSRYFGMVDEIRIVSDHPGLLYVIGFG